MQPSGCPRILISLSALSSRAIHSTSEDIVYYYTRARFSGTLSYQSRRRQPNRIAATLLCWQPIIHGILLLHDLRTIIQAVL